MVLPHFLDTIMNHTTAEQHFKAFMDCLGLDTKSPDTKDTPARVAKVYQELLANNGKTLSITIDDPKDDTEIKLLKFDKGGMNELVTLFGIDFTSVCSHHLLPFTGKAHIGYLPDDFVAGVSKLARVVEFYSKKMQMQEHLTEDIANFLYDNLQPHWLIVVLEAKHLCMSIRGVKKSDAVMKTSKILCDGHISDYNGLRQEFFTLKGH